MCCGGSVEVLIEPIRPAAHVLIVGAGHVGAITAPLLAGLGFRVRLCDAREEVVDPSRLAAQLLAPALPAPGPDSPLEVGHAPALPTVPVELVCADHDDPEVLAGFPAQLDRSACVVMTHDHQLDQAAVEWALAAASASSAASAVAPRRRARAPGWRPRVQAPPMSRGCACLSASTSVRVRPAEIAVAIGAELIGWRAKLFATRRVAAFGRDAVP